MGEFHDAFGVKIADAPKLHVFDEDPKLVKLRMDLIDEEVRELREAMEQKDPDATIDALTDILYVVYGDGVSFGMDLDRDFKIVHASNMSKLCATEEVAKATVAQYQEQWNKGEGKYDSAAYRRSDDGKFWVVYNQSSGKVLKSMMWTPPNFDTLGVPSSSGSGGA